MKLIGVFVVLFALLSVGAAKGKDKSNKIVAGNDAVVGQFPFYAAIIKNGELLCGSSIIGSNVILTAAHCFDPNPQPADFKIGFGGITIAGMTQVDVLSIFIHESYDTQTSANDIALIITATDIPIGSSTVQAINYTSTVDTTFDSDTLLYAVGLGALNGGSNQQFPTTLQWTKLLHYEIFACSEAYVDQGINTITLSQICASSNVTDTCQGDSGGPLVYSPNQSGVPGVPLESPYVVGVVSFGIDCATGIPGVYTRVSSYNEWINGKLPTPSSSVSGSAAAASSVETSSVVASSVVASSVAASNTGASTACISVGTDQTTCLSNPLCRFSGRLGTCRYNCKGKSQTECSSDSNCKYISSTGACRTRRGV